MSEGKRPDVQTSRVDLSDAELLLLDGRCSEKAQAEVDAAKRRAALSASLGPAVFDADARLVQEIVDEAVKNGQLAFYHKSCDHCSTCGKSAGYAKHKRSGRYHRKGQDNYKKPLSLPGIELADRFITIKGHITVGCCRECWDRVKPLVVAAIADVRAEIPEAITGQPPRFKKYDRRKCGKCGWEGHDGQLGMLPALMGGQYPGKCPGCGAENLPFGRIVIESVPGFDVVPVQIPAPQKESR